MPPRFVGLRHFPFILACSWAGFSEPLLHAGRPTESIIPDADLAASGDLFAKADGAQANPTPSDTPRVSTNVTINLINRLVDRGFLTKEDADDLIRQAENDATRAREQFVATANTMTQVAAMAQAAQQAASDASAAPESDDAVRVTYIPEIVKAQMRDQIREEVIAQAREEKWVAPQVVPDWVPRFRVTGDVRVRYEGDFFPDGNDNTGSFPNFNAINTGTPFDTSGTVFSPQYNVDQNRNRFRLRARLGAEVDLGEGFTAGLRIGTGENNSPVTENQSFGAANQGQGGNFSKYAIWLDRGFLKYEALGQPNKYFGATIGRFDNPFFVATPMIWASDLGFDGAVLKGRYEVAKGLTPFLTAGAFPVFNTDLNFSSNQPAKFKSEDKYLYGGQLGTDWKAKKDLTMKVGAAYYYFDNIEGKLSDPYTPQNAQDAGNTDGSRPAFAQTGNTYMALRNIVPNATNNYGTSNQYQYYGLATKFHELALTGRIDYDVFEPVRISLSGEYVKNLAFNEGEINAKAVNNRGPNTTAGAIGSFDGGDTAWIVNLKVGSAALAKRGDWNVYADYRYVESDSLVDGFADSDFGGTLLGTNHKGYTIGGSLSLSSSVWLGLRWMSADSIAGAPFKNDLVQFDINGGF